MLSKGDKDGVHHDGAVEQVFGRVAGNGHLPADAEGFHHALHRDISALEKFTVCLS